MVPTQIIALLLSATVGVMSQQMCEQSSRTWCNATLSFDDRITSLLTELTVPEKAGLLSNTAQAVPRLGLRAYDWWNEAVHGFAR